MTKFDLLSLDFCVFFFQHLFDGTRISVPAFWRFDI